MTGGRNVEDRERPVVLPRVENRADQDARIERHLRGDRRPVEGGVDHADRVELTEAEVVVDGDANAVGGPVGVGLIDGLGGLDEAAALLELFDSLLQRLD